ncbi:LysM peptidoglycan-binding domain-containing protein [Pseudarthrobacter sp. J1738]|uniref:LysM peptidoglycan-binding domain-containing protein n=1 Tax=unclassified Pseudarthrobacter TaxID=2647000 RepID=UPI003D2AAF54
MSHEHSALDLLLAADPALAITEEELDRSRQQSASFINSDVTHIAVGGSISDFHRVPAKRHWGRFALAGLVAAAIVAIAFAAWALVPSVDHSATVPTDAATSTSAATDNGVRILLGGRPVADSFGNVDYYTTIPGDTSAAVADAFNLSQAKLAEFNGLTVGSELAPNTTLRLIPKPGAIKGAMGKATVDANGIPTSYVIEPNDTLDGITYRFGITEEQLAEANKVAITYEKGNVYFVRAGKHIQLQKNPVDSRAGGGIRVNNSFHNTVFYTTVAGDSFDSLGYEFRITTEQLLRWNPTLHADWPIPSGTKMSLMPGAVAIEGARGTFTADAKGIPQTYNTVPGDTEDQIAARFGIPDALSLAAANPPPTGPKSVWYAYKDMVAGELAGGQTISLDQANQIHR